MFKNFYKLFNPFHATGLFLYFLKTSEKQKFFNIFRGKKASGMKRVKELVMRNLCIKKQKIKRPNFFFFFSFYDIFDFILLVAKKIHQFIYKSEEVSIR